MAASSRVALRVYCAIAVVVLARMVSPAQAQDCDKEFILGTTIDPAFGADNGETVNVVKQCTVNGQPTRDPFCYLSAGVLPQRFFARADAAASSFGDFWDAECQPAMAFAVDDGTGPRGLVIAGADPQTAAVVQAAVRDHPTLTWSAAFEDGIEIENGRFVSRRASCLISFDWRAPPDARDGHAELHSSAIADFYVHYCPSGACDAPPNKNEAWPRDGLGIARGAEVEAFWLRHPTFAPFDPHAKPDIQRFAFTRGVLYARDFARVVDGCAPSEAVAATLEDIEAFDPTGGPPRFRHPVKCLAASSMGSTSVLPPGVTLLPPALDAALRQSAEARAAGVAGGSRCWLEGIPFGLVADAFFRPVAAAASTQVASGDAYLLGTRALIFVGLDARAAPEFTLVPEPIAFLDQQLVLKARANATSSLVVAPLRPLGASVAGREVDLGDGTEDAVPRRRAAQRFAIEDDAIRSVEAFETLDATRPLWPPHASTVDVSVRYGTRWTSNDGPPDCWATTALAEPGDAWQRFAYPASSGSEQVAVDFCPNELNAWLTRTRETREAPEGLCKVSLEAMDEDKIATVLAAISHCATRLPDGGIPDAGVPPVSVHAAARDADPSDAGPRDAGPCGDDRSEPTQNPQQLACRRCLQSGCDPLHPSTCPGNPDCNRFFTRLRHLSGDDQQCISDHVLAHTEQALPASKHWVDVLDGEVQRLIAMVGLVRSNVDKEGRALPPSQAADHDHDTMADEANPATADSYWPSTISQMTAGDSFVGGAHQTLDWNWIVEPDRVEAIDPAYRAIAARSGRYIAVENELEMGVPAGMWDAHVRLVDGHSFNTHGEPFPEFLAGLKTTSDAQGFGEIWPTDFCRDFGLERRGNSIPTCACTTACISCDEEIPADGSVRDAGVAPGCGVGRRYFRTHLGRGIFSPITAETAPVEWTAGASLPETASMATNPAWPACIRGEAAGPAKDAVVPLGLEDWGACPHRISYLGRPILDCGHGDGECDEGLRLEIHPPHVLTMELRRAMRRDDSQPSCSNFEPCSRPEVEPGCTPGIVVGVFGWANVLVGRHLEFDLWPPARPSLDSTLCVLGHDHDETGSALGSGPLPIVADLGYRIVRPPEAPPCGTLANAGAPRLVCNPRPQRAPDHVHCVYDDPGAEYGDVDDCGEDAKCAADSAQGGALTCRKDLPVPRKWTYGNPRMTPRFATSLFEARIFIGWRSDGLECPRCPEDGGPCFE